MNEALEYLLKFDFSVLDDPAFKEDSVREEIVKLLLNALEYDIKGQNRIVRSKTLAHPFVKIGTGKRKITNFPDYILQVELVDKWVLDAKAPEEEIKAGEHVEQTYFYAIHPDVRVDIFALCNGREFIAYHISQEEPLIYFQLSELGSYWEQLKAILSPQALAAREFLAEAAAIVPDELDYRKIKPLSEVKAITKQAAKRHFGVHAYFTKQAWQVVISYIKNFTKPGDIVLDPFGGTGVTLVEALLLGRKAIHVDLNPLSVFIVENLIRPIDFVQLNTAFIAIKADFNKNAPKTQAEIRAALKKYPFPKDIPLMKNADVDSIEKLFSPVQLAQLAYLKHLIMQVPQEDIRAILLLMFSGLLNKINLTYHASAKKTIGQGDSGMFRYYRYRLAPKPASLDVMTYFESRFKKVSAGKREISGLINERTIENAQVYKGTATNLDKIPDESIDYIYTDPPYGSKIPYLDLSVMWNSWLDLPVEEEDYELEIIEGGEHNKTKENYAELIGESFIEMYRVLKFDRWMSFVFAHKDPSYWHIIVETAEAAGFEYAGAVTQNNGQATFKKRQNPFTVLKGQLIINFKKVKHPQALMKVNLGADITAIITETIESVIAREHGATIEQINDELIIKGLELGFLDILSKKYKDLTPFVSANFAYDKETEEYHLKKDTKFQTLIDIEVRVRYYTFSYLKRMSLQHEDPTFDEIVLYIMPLLRNGVDPEKETVLNVLNQIAHRVGEDRWRLNSVGQGHLFERSIP